MDARELKDLASDYFRKGKFAKAAEAYLSLTKIDPRELQHHIKLGDSYRRDGQKEKAIEAYRDAVDGYARQGIMIKAIATCKLILEIDPAHKRAQEALAQLCAQRYARPTEPAVAAPPAQPPAAGRHFPESIELPDDASDSLELDDGRPIQAKSAGPGTPIRPLPPIRHEAPRPEAPAQHAAPPVVRQLQQPSLVDAIEFEEVEPQKAPPLRPRAKASLQGPAEIELDLEVSSAPASRPTRIEVTSPTGQQDEAELEQIEVIEGDELPLASSILSAATTAEHEVLSRAATEAGAPTTAMASILASATDDTTGEVELFSVTAGKPARGRAKGHSSSPAAGVEIDLFEGGSPPPKATEEEQQAALLAEEAAFDLVPSGPAEATLPAEPAPAAIPSTDLSQESVPLFSELPKDAFIDLLEQLTFRRVASGEVIVREGDVGKSIYVLANGHARVVKGLGSPQPIELAKLNEGAFFGEMALLNGAPRVASVVASADSEVLELTEQILRQLTAKHPSVGQSLKRFYRQRLLANVMAISPLFRAFDKADRKALVEKFKLREVQCEEQVIKEGQAPDGLYVVMHGAALVTKHDSAERREIPLAVLKEGDVFGEMSLLTRRPASATVTAKRKTLMLRLPKASFDELMFTHPAVLEVVSELSDQRTKVNEQILSGALDAPREALAFL